MLVVAAVVEASFSVVVAGRRASFRVDIYTQGKTARNSSDSISTIRVNVEQKAFHAHFNERLRYKI